MANKEKKAAASAEQAGAAAANLDADLQERMDGFNAELKPLLGKYELGLGASAFINPNGTIGANPVVLSMRGQGVAKAGMTEA